MALKFRRGGFTLLELAVYLFMLMLAGLAVYALYAMGTRARQTTISSFLVSVETETAIRWLRRDLQETALVSVRTYPNEDHPSEPPGCSFVSARASSEQDAAQLNVNAYGAPLWTKRVFYTLVSGGPRTGQLVRWEKELTKEEKDNVPRATDDPLPSSISSDKTRRTVMKTVLLPKVKVENLGGAPTFMTDAFGGFRLQFVRRAGGAGGAESMSSMNPGENEKKPEAADNTSLLEVELKLLTSDTSRPSVYDIKLRVHPRF